MIKKKIGAVSSDFPHVTYVTKDVCVYVLYHCEIAQKLGWKTS
jgi:hypothetical protein